MPLIDYGDGLVIDARDGMTVLEASIQHGISHIHACGGNARCTTCRLNVLEGHENCPPMSEAERKVLALTGYEHPVRLACQLRPTGPIKICCLLKDYPKSDATPEGMARERDVAVLMADIRNFTSFAERNLAFDVLHLLNRYFDRVGTIVEDNRGRVITFLGDGAVCLFEDLDSARAAESAVRSGLEIIRASEVFGRYTQESFAFEMKVGVGIAWGRAVIGRLGYYNRSDLNVVGDVVNTASRVQDVTRDVGVSLLVSEPIRELIGSRFTFGQVFTVGLKGKELLHDLHEVLP